ncbi:MAG: hypothetical protein RLZZ399_1199 [Verrucomicrobiota bacterium]|jgi:processive 1,2-diacylglycerol beta-glucosyltransferase
MGMRTVLILTAAFGEGHNAAARGLKEAFDAEGVRAEVLDPFGPAFGKWYEWTRRNYVRMVNQAPWVWSLLYGWVDLVSFPTLGLKFLRPLERQLQWALDQWKPSVVVSVFPIYGYFLAGAARRAGVPKPRLFTVVTDSISVNSLWYRCESDALLLPNEDTADVLLGAGVCREQIVVTGFPVSPRFASESGRVAPPGPGQKPKVLLMVNGQRLRALALVERILREGEVELTVTVGRDAELGRWLERVGQGCGRPLRVLGWVGDVPALMREHHLLIGKAGGATVQEALAAHLPMLVTQILPGQEEGNARLLVQNGCGVHCPTNESVIQCLRSLLAGTCEGWTRMHDHTKRLGRPDASTQTVRWILSRPTLPEREANEAFGVRPV